MRRRTNIANSYRVAHDAISPVSVVKSTNGPLPSLCGYRECIFCGAVRFTALYSYDYHVSDWLACYKCCGSRGVNAFDPAANRRLIEKELRRRQEQRRRRRRGVAARAFK